MANRLPRPVPRPSAVMHGPASRHGRAAAGGITRQRQPPPTSAAGSSTTRAHRRLVVGVRLGLARLGACRRGSFLQPAATSAVRARRREPLAPVPTIVGRARVGRLRRGCLRARPGTPEARLCLGPASSFAPDLGSPVVRPRALRMTLGLRGGKVRAAARRCQPARSRRRCAWSRTLSRAACTIAACAAASAADAAARERASGALSKANDMTPPHDRRRRGRSRAGCRPRASRHPG